MKGSSIVDGLELALIELEYAVADFAHQRSALNVEAERRELETLLSKLMRAKRTVRNAIAALDASHEAAAEKPPHRRSRRGPFAA